MEARRGETEQSSQNGGETRRNVPAEYRLAFDGLQDATYRKTELFVSTSSPSTNQNLKLQKDKLTAKLTKTNA
jgi:hypothetical protein